MKDMRIGHVDGKGIVYNDNGNPILLEGESIVQTLDDDQLDVSEGSSILNMKHLFGHTAEKGRLILTDRRLLFLSRPDPFLAAKYDAYPLGLADALSKAYRARSLDKTRALEFCEINYSEVEGFMVKKRRYGVLFLKNPEKVTRKAILYQRGRQDDKFLVLKSLLASWLPLSEPEDRKGNFLLGRRYPFLGKHK